ncbi:hypothetical protein [Scytonema sp. NUACC26]|uniref:hypothetical protein n=1 Tax=Scytonema sp. NUACC26 TaxID=3140176 RepID=UPI0038B2E5D1
MSLEINRLKQQLDPIIDPQWEGENEYDELTLKDEVKLEEVEDVREIFSRLCEELQNSNLVRFRVEGFGELPWPVDVLTDFLTVIEQVSDLLKFLDTPESSIGYLDFYEQGIQKRLVFNKEDDLIKINCHGILINNQGGKLATSWGQDIEEEPIEKKSLKSMICQLIKTFVLIANEVSPTLTSNIFFQEWCSDQYIANCLLE